MSECPRIGAVILDLDNTLYDWVGAFVPAFYAMVDTACSIGQLDREQLLDDFQKVHQYHGDTEHPFALLECDVVRQKFASYSKEQLREHFDPAFHKFNSIRKRNLCLYAGVREALVALAGHEIPVLAYSDARIVHCLFRLRSLGIQPCFRGLYSPAQRFSDANGWDLKSDADFVSILPSEDRKPNPKTLLDVCKRIGLPPKSILYVGDSLVRDIYMAKSAGCWAAWAKYGTVYDKALWLKLVRVTHWTEEDIEADARLRSVSANVTPDATLDRLDEIFSYFDFA